MLKPVARGEYVIEAVLPHEKYRDLVTEYVVMARWVRNKGTRGPPSECKGIY